MGKRRDFRDHEASSTESGNEAPNLSKVNGGEVCSHITKAIDSTVIRKKIKTSGFDRHCGKCAQDAAPGHGEELWLCLKCGTQLCDRAKNQHALEHYNTPRSDVHALAMNTSTFHVWCYSCNTQVEPNAKPKLLEIVEHSKREAGKLGASIGSQEVNGQQEQQQQQQQQQQMEQVTESVRSMMIDVLKSPTMMNHASLDGVGDGVRNGAGDGKGLAPSMNTLTGSKRSQFAGMIGASAVRPLSVQQQLPRVRGLSNLGNTCFFNAVLQCLARTPYLLSILQEAATGGEKVHIPGGVLKLPDGTETTLPPIDGELERWSSLSEALADTLEQLTGSEASVVKPGRLLSEVTKKWPQFSGGDQHDSHELLRHLLESARTEDLRRYQSVILQALRFERRSPMDDNRKAMVRFYGDQIAQWVFRPEQIFRGSLVSTLTCQDCYHTSSRHEYFLDISLPVCVEKPQPPAATGAGGRTKSSCKKERARENKAKRTAKHQKNRTNLQSTEGASEAGSGGNAIAEGTAQLHFLPSSPFVRVVGSSPFDDEEPVEGDEEEDASGNESSDGGGSNEPSDADVEDNDVTDDPKEGAGSNSFMLLRGTDLDLERIEPIVAALEKQDDAPENCNKEPDRERRPGGARQRTYSYADWSNTIAPRYQCEDGEYSVQSCFNNFTTVELMTGNNKVCCEACTERINGKDGKSVNTNATKQFLISVPPAVLILHLKRFQVGPRGLFRKITKPVSFPFVLDIAPFCGSKVKRAAHIRPGQKKILYALYGLVEHLGSMYGGHYVAYVKVRPPFAGDDHRWKFIPQGTKDELDRKSEEEMAKEQARRMGVLVDNSAVDAYNNEAEENARPSAAVAPVAVEEETKKGQAEVIPDVEPPPGKWYHVSDSRVREVSEDTVLKGQAYLLFYERIF